MRYRLYFFVVPVLFMTFLFMSSEVYSETLKQAVGKDDVVGLTNEEVDESIEIKSTGRPKGKAAVPAFDPYSMPTNQRVVYIKRILKNLGNEKPDVIELPAEIYALVEEQTHCMENDYCLDALIHRHQKTVYIDKKGVELSSVPNAAKLQNLLAQGVVQQKTFVWFVLTRSSYEFDYNKKRGDALVIEQMVFPEQYNELLEKMFLIPNTHYLSINLEDGKSVTVYKNVVLGAIKERFLGDILEITGE